MRVRIHRGANEIGGNCIELEAEGERIVLDLGRPISATRDQVVPLPPIDGLDPGSAARRPLALLLSHAHLDHYGLACGLADQTPIYMGEAAYRVLEEALFFTGAPLLPRPRGFLVHRRPIQVGPFKVTPYLNDHSAFDAYSLLIEAGTRRLFYTGDFRGHGRKGRLLDELCADPPRGVDVLLMEGTNMRADCDLERAGPTEADAEAQVAAIARRTSGIVLAMFSPQNIDRLVTFYRAALRSGRELVVDLYTAAIASATGCDTIPQASWERVRVYLPNAQRRRVIDAEAFARTDAVRGRRIYAEELRARRHELIMLFRSSMSREIERADCLDGAHAIWSMWPGYLRDLSGERLTRWLAAREIPMTIAHSSGHAWPRDLRRLTDALAPTALVPIHTTHPASYAAFDISAKPARDGDWLPV